MAIPAPAASPVQRLTVRVGADAPFGIVADALRASVSGGERAASVFVIDSQGRERTITFLLDYRLGAGPLFPQLVDEWVPGENAIRVRRLQDGSARIEHLGRRITEPDIGPVLSAVFDLHKDLYFPSGEPPSRQEFPVIIDAAPDVRFQDVVSALTRAQAAGFGNCFADLRGGRS